MKGHITNQIKTTLDVKANQKQQSKWLYVCGDIKISKKIWPKILASLKLHKICFKTLAS